MDRIGLGGAGWLATLAVAGWGLAAAAVLVSTRLVMGEAVARRTAPLLVLLPAAVWAGTSLDAVFAGLSAWGIAFAVAGAVRASPWRVVAAGFVLGTALLLTYGAVLLVLVAVAVLMVEGQRIGRAAALCALVVGIVVPLAVAAAAGFDWFDGLEATRGAYWSGIASRRPAAYLTLLGNPAVLAVALGPAVVVGLVELVAGSARATRAPVRLRGAVLPLAVLVAVVVADLSQYARGEVERIWLPFVPWLAIAAGASRAGRRWLVAQAGLALVVQSVLVSPW